MELVSLIVRSQIRCPTFTAEDFSRSWNPYLWQKMMSAMMGHGMTGIVGAGAMTGIEMALWDIIGQACGQPVHRLLGGKFHDRINHFGFLQGDDPVKLADHAEALTVSGFDVLYLKVGRGRERDRNYQSWLYPVRARYPGR